MALAQAAKSAALAAAVSLALVQGASAFDLDKVTVRGRAIYIDPADKSSGGTLIKDDVDVESKWAPDIDFEYALAEHWGLELLLTIPQEHEVSLKSNGTELGTVDHLPPTLTAKYYFLTDRFRPYVGAGVNFTLFTDDNLNGLDVDDSSVGPALQAGFDIGLNRNWSLSFDAKKVWIDTDVTQAGTNARVTTVDIDPWIYGIGFGYRFGQAAPAPKPAAAPTPVAAPAPPPPPAPPPADSDRDGVIDRSDRCPNTSAGARVDANGCELDSDNDAVVDRLDKCPGTPQGAKVDAGGCEVLISLKGVNFQTNSANITPESVAILDNAVGVLKQRAGATVEVQGHTDSAGNDAYNQSLSQRRAEAVRDYLVQNGVAASMLSAKGYGESQPIASNDTPEGRAENRRVDLKFQ